MVVRTLAAFPFVMNLLAGFVAQAEPLRIPAATAYLEPDSRSTQVSERRGITRWSDPEVSVVWYGNLREAGPLTAKVVVELDPLERVELRLSVAGQERRVEARGKAGEESVVAELGEFTIADPGYQAFTLSSPAPRGTIRGLLLDGEVLQEAHFNLKPRRNAASVHLAYPESKETEVSAFYCEMTGVEDPLWTYYMACGWHRGYFGMQVNSASERRIIFSVWDSGSEAIDRNKVEQENRVTLIDKGDGVYSGDFGNEGTGGHSHLKYPWKTGQRQRFLVTAEPVNESFTIFSGYYFHPDSRDWMLISSWKAPQEGKYMRGLYSFSENFVGRNGHVFRKALYGNQWIRTAGGEWIELKRATFSHDATGKADRLDRFMGLAEDGQFFLAHGGFREGFTEFGEAFDRPASGRSPADGELPPLPPVVGFK